MTKLNIIGAFDRFNYGDVLFVYILKKKLISFKNDYEFQYVSTAGRDLRNKGGFFTVPMKEMLKNSKGASVFLIAGGEVLAASWWYMQLCLVESENIEREQKKLNRIGSDKANKRAQAFFKCYHKFPWVMERKLMYNSEGLIIYNAVGGSSVQNLLPDDRAYIAKHLETANYISVRDDESKKVLSDAGMPESQLKVYPDCGILVSEVFTTLNINEKVRVAAKKLVEESGEYIVFQAGRYHVIKHDSIETIIKELHKIVETENATIILVPFSNASFHEDHIILKEIFLKAKHSRIKLFSDINMFDITYIVRHARLFMGTSLHGNMIAFSYGIPAIGLTYIDAKLPKFIETWIKPEADFQVCYEFNQIHEAYVKNKDLNKDKYLENARIAIKLGNENIDNISLLIQENSKKIKPSSKGVFSLKRLFGRR